MPSVTQKDKVSALNGEYAFMLAASSRRVSKREIGLYAAMTKRINEGLMTVHEACAYLNVSSDTVYRLIKRGCLRAHKPGYSPLVTFLYTSEVDALAKSLPSDTQS